MNSEYDKTVIDYLTWLGYIGRLWPVSKKETRLEIIAVLTATVDPCIDQLICRFGLELTKAEFMQLMERNNIMVFKTIEDYNRKKQELEAQLRAMNTLERLQADNEYIRANRAA